jgi:predicted permease
MTSLLQNLRVAVRMLAKSPGFTAVAVVTLALGIGANTAVFSVLDTVLLRPLPYKSPEQLVLVTETLPQQGHEELGVSAAEYFDYRNRNRSFSEVAAFVRDGFNLTGEGTPLRIVAARVSASTFPLLGVKPTLGRVFNDSEDRTGTERVAIISHALWQNHFGGNPAVLGKTLKLDEQPTTIIGVMPASFLFPFDGNAPWERADLWIPVAFPADLLQDRVREFGVGLVGRLKPGVGESQAQQDMTGIADNFMKENAGVYSGTIRVSPFAHPYAVYTLQKSRQLVLLLIAAVAFVLMIACANVANLLLARANGRVREMSIRTALGASRTVLMKQCLLESSLLSVLGAGTGIILAVFLVESLRKFGPANLPRLQDVTLHPGTLLFTLLLSLATSFIFGFVPAWRLSQTSPQECLKETGQVGKARNAHRLQNIVAATEIAAALVLLIGSSLLIRSFVNVLNAPLGIQPEKALVVRTIFDHTRYPDPLKRDEAQKQLLDKLSRLPGIASAAMASHLPLSDERQIGFRLETAAPDDFHWAANSLVSPGYFGTMGISLIRGRDFNLTDRHDTPNVAVINEALAKQFLPAQDPIGKRFHWGGLAVFTIVGIAGDVRVSSLDADPPPTIYYSAFQVDRGASGRSAFVLRTTASDSSLQQGIFRAVQEQIWSVDKDLPIYGTTTISSMIAESLAQRRFTTLLMGGFAAIALLLATIGLSGVVSFIVSERTREMALRMALGAQPGQILYIVLREAGSLGVVGCLAGLALFRALSGLFEASLYQVRVFDPLAIAGVPLLLLGVTLLAAYLPAHRATQVEPLIALRYE